MATVFLTPTIILPLTLMASVMLANPLAACPGSQPLPAETDQQVQPTEQSEWGIFPDAIPQLTAGNISNLDRANTLRASVNSSQFGEMAQLAIVLSDGDRVGQTSTSNVWQWMQFRH